VSRFPFSNDAARKTTTTNKQRTTTNKQQRFRSHNVRNAADAIAIANFDVNLFALVDRQRASHTNRGSAFGIYFL
jgi:hypothetical protein